ncbi:putative F-box protein PP2-B12 [Solanum pennellii]|uniref:F-box protein PP2-B12 n=1 Tax=Solanum pennellii TaxID=28526 RepID=A0ABM1FGR6_SOLPN|nr:putative F-box protein PP2-B12 [Solanum pennellii]
MKKINILQNLTIKKKQISTINISSRKCNGKTQSMEKEQSKKNNSNTCLSMLPEECITKIFAFTSPQDVCRFSLVSTYLHSAADSDSVWAKFLPSDYLSIITKSETPIPDFRSLKDAYVYLADHPLLIDEGHKSFSLDKWTGKKCYFLGARDLNLSWGDSLEHWKWISVPESRFPEVAWLELVWWFQILGTIRAGILSPLTSYTAYLVYKLEDYSYGSDARNVEVSVEFCGVKSANVRFLFLDPDHPSNMELDHKPVPKLRKDGWFELELGNFSTENEDDCIELTIEDVIPDFQAKGGLIVEGFEIRPTIA